MLAIQKYIHRYFLSVFLCIKFSVCLWSSEINSCLAAFDIKFHRQEQRRDGVFFHFTAADKILCETKTPLGKPNLCEIPM